MTPETLDKPHEGPRIARLTAVGLRSIAGALYETGNHHLAERLKGLAADCLTSAELVEEGTNEAFSSMLEASEAATTNMVRAALAVTMRGAK